METEYENKTLTVEFKGVEYEVEARVETSIERWTENHGPGLLESMAEETYEGYEVVTCLPEYPDDREFDKLLEEKIKEDYL